MRNESFANDLVRFLEQEIYSLDGKVILNANPAQMKYLAEINERLLSLGPNKTSGKFEVLQLVLLLTNRQKKNDHIKMKTDYL